MRETNKKKTLNETTKTAHQTPAMEKTIKEKINMEIVLNETKKMGKVTNKANETNERTETRQMRR